MDNDKNSKQKVESTVQKKLDEIKPYDYSNLKNDFSEWLKINEDLPESFWLKVKNTNEEKNIDSMIVKIKQELFSLYGDKRDTAKSFQDSRFTPLSEMIERKMATCGSTTKIIGTVLRKFDIPVKFVHGILRSQQKSFFKRVLLKERHAWLEIYAPKTKEWVPVDLTRKDFSLYPDAIKIKEYHDWGELKGDYMKGNF